jgi:hypothetical protein
VPFSKSQNIAAMDIRDTIKNYVKTGFDFIKILSSEPAICDSIITIGHASNLSVAGHVANGYFNRAIDLKQNSIEHIEPLIFNYKSDPDGFIQSLRKIANSDIFLCPDIYWYYINWKQIPLDTLNKSTGINFFKDDVDGWNDILRQRNIKKEDLAKYENFLRDYSKIFAVAVAENVAILPGTGDGPFIIPGYSLHSELKYFVKMGMSPFQALKSATIVSAKFLGIDHLYGTVTVDKIANLVLLNKNPLVDINNLESLNGIMVHGKWLSSSSLTETLSTK